MKGDDEIAKVSRALIGMDVEHRERDLIHKYSDNLTRCMRLVRKEHNQRIKIGGTLTLYNLCTKVE